MLQFKILIFVLLTSPILIFAQNEQQSDIRRETGKFAVLSGLHQPIVLKGGNFAFNYTTRKNLSLEASFGVGLRYDNILSDDELQKYASVQTPFSYGIGIGYFYKGFSLNFEPKGTMFRVRDHEGQEIQYTTWSLGAGLYYNVFLWKGLFLQPSIRYWHKVGSTLPGDEFVLRNAESVPFVHEARKPGSNGWIYGVSVGWYFK